MHKDNWEILFFKAQEYERMIQFKYFFFLGGKGNVW
jgi:hypothetical protein